MGMTDLALEKSFDPQQQSYLETVKLSADSLLALINDILDFSKIEAGQMELDEHPFLLAEAIEAAMRTVSILSKEKGLEITLEIAPDVPVAVAGDSLRLRHNPHIPEQDRMYRSSVTALLFHINLHDPHRHPYLHLLFY
ncbi:MAG: hypothetical protein D3917_08240, partial [Candidatus Electrothrix sp. AX5]|nr:hypothetical protein [Candidatus Electrothrix sp. AX5]